MAGTLARTGRRQDGKAPTVRQRYVQIGGSIIAVVLFPLGIIFFGVSALEYKFLYAAVAVTLFSVALATGCYYYGQKMSGQRLSQVTNVLCCCGACEGQPVSGSQERRSPSAVEVMRQASLRGDVDRSDRILMESLRRFARTPIQNLYKDYNALLNDYNQLARQYPNNRRVKRAVPQYVEVMEDDIQLVFEWLTGAQSYTNRDIIRMKQRTAAFQGALVYIKRKAEELEDSDTEAQDNVKASETSSRVANVTASGTSSAVGNVTTSGTSSAVGNVTSSGTSSAVGLRVALPTVTTSQSDSVSPQSSQTRSLNYSNTVALASQFARHSQHEGTTQTYDSPPRPPRPTSPEVVFPCPPPYREIDPEAPPIYTVSDGQMRAFRVSQTSFEVYNSSWDSFSSAPGPVSFTTMPRGGGLTAAPDTDDAPPSYEEAVSSPV